MDRPCKSGFRPARYYISSGCPFLMFLILETEGWGGLTFKLAPSQPLFDLLVGAIRNASVPVATDVVFTSLTRGSMASGLGPDAIALYLQCWYRTLCLT